MTLASTVTRQHKEEKHKSFCTTHKNTFQEKSELQLTPLVYNNKKLLTTDTIIRLQEIKKELDIW
jgi:hypothetical protein